MKMMNIYKKHENLILATIYISGMILFLCWRYSFVYYISDDLSLRNIVSGSFTGTPETRNINMLYPLSALLSWFYRFFPTFRGTSLPWYGLFLIACQFLSLAVIACRSLLFCRHSHTKILMLILQAAIAYSTMLYHLLAVTFSVTSGFMAMAAVFYFLSTENELALSPNHALLITHIPTVTLVLMACLIRVEVGLLTLPFFLFTGLYKYWKSSKTRETLIKYAMIMGVLVFALGLAYVVHIMAYNSSEWRKFTVFDDEREKAMDYYPVPEYGENKEFYDGLGVTAMDLGMFKQWELALADSIDEKTMGEIAAYSKRLFEQDSTFFERLYENTKFYVRHFLASEAGGGQPRRSEEAYYRFIFAYERSGAPFNTFVLMGYAALLGISIIKGKPKQMILMLVLLAMLRSGLWMYVIMNGRILIRVTTPLYLTELALLFGMYLNEAATMQEKTKPVSMVIGMLLFAVAVTQVPTLPGDIEEKSHGSASYRVLNEYLLEHPENFYFTPTRFYPWEFNVFGGSGDQALNIAQLGNWSAKSPHYEKKLNLFMPYDVARSGNDIYQALATMDNIYIVAESHQDIGYLEEYFQEKDIWSWANLVVVDSIGESFTVYELRLIVP